jgi:CRP-like cAMP-binding protein
MPTPYTPRSNRLLASLPRADYDRFTPHLELHELGLGQVLSEAGSLTQYAYFPADCVVSLLQVMKNGDTAEIAIVGNEGVVGLASVMGGDSTPSRALLQSAGAAFRLSAESLRLEFMRGESLQRGLLRYTQALITQMAQTAVCNRHHTVEQQFCRWVLMSLDRLRSNQLNMTQELIANMLGVRRERVTEAAGKLQDGGFIHYSRGRIVVVDRAKLESHVCECYALVKAEFDRLLLPPSGG